MSNLFYNPKQVERERENRPRLLIGVFPAHIVGVTIGTVIERNKKANGVFVEPPYVHKSVPFNFLCRIAPEAEGFVGKEFKNPSKEVDGKDPLENALSDKLSKLLLKAGYKANGDVIVRTDSTPIKRDKMINLGWEPANIRDATTKTIQMLGYLRVHDRRVVDEAKRNVKDLANDEEAIKEAKNQLNNRSKAIVVVDRISLILSAQIIHIIEALRDKKN